MMGNMKTIIFILFLSLSVWAAHSEYVWGSGYANGMCHGDAFATMCISQLKTQAESDAARDGQMQCSLKQGVLASYTASCMTNCNPTFISPNQNAFVNCNSRCQYRCDIQNN
jgi:hypothetical protein